MGVFKTEVTLTNSGDLSAAGNGLIPKGRIRSLTLDVKPDTAAWTLVLTEKTRLALGLSFTGNVMSKLANGTSVVTHITEPVQIRWKDRSATIDAIVLPNARNVLLGALPLEALDLVVDPVHKCLRGAHGKKPVCEL
jgi:predicted aspartyl protease